MPPTLTLADAVIGKIFTVCRLMTSSAQQEWKTQLEDIGFLPGERVAVMARGLPGGDPLVIRVGVSTFALRRVEAACVEVVDVMTANHAESS